MREKGRGLAVGPSLFFFQKDIFWEKNRPNFRI